MGNLGKVVELKDLEAREVSLVDSPAIAEKFTVIKRQKGGNEKMSDEEKKNKDEEKQDEEKQDEETKDEKKEETQADKDEEKKEEETQAANPQMVGALKQIMSLVQKLMKMTGAGGYGEPTKKSENGEDADALMAQVEYMMESLSKGELPDEEEVTKAGKRVTPARLNRLESFMAELGKFISELKGEEKADEKEETKKAEDKEETKTEETRDDKILAELGKINKRLDKVEASAGLGRGESTDEASGDKEKTEKNEEGSLAPFFTGIGGIQ